MPSVPHDRVLQDRVIRFLTDSDLRADDFEFLEPSEAERAHRFSRFLARRYYRDRLRRAFRYSARLGGIQAAEDMADLPEFDKVLDRSVLGSFATATLVGELVISGLTSPSRESWRRDLLEYERAFFLQLATSEPTPASAHPRLRVATVVRRFPMRVAELLARVTDGEPIEQGQLEGETRLLFSRTDHGQVYVAELDARAVSVLGKVDGQRDADAIAESVGVSVTEVQRQLATLAELGAVVLPCQSSIAG